MKSKLPLARRGRPRTFDLEQALERAMKVFWRKGYEGASLPDLTRAMRINKPSMYAAFGNKESLFRKALDRYAENPSQYIQDALAQPTAAAVAKRLLGGAAELMTDPRHPRGCLNVQGALACGESSECIRKELIARREMMVTRMRKRFEQAKAENDLPPDADPGDLARYIATVINGMSVQASSGATREQLRRIAETALRAWPK